MDLKIIEPIRNYLKEFNTPDEFNLYYQTKKDELDNLTTHKLNKMFHIKDYRITKIKGELMLKKWNEIEKEESTNVEEQINLLKEEITKIKDTINRIVDYLNRS